MRVNIPVLSTFSPHFVITNTTKEIKCLPSSVYDERSNISQAENKAHIVYGKTNTFLGTFRVKKKNTYCCVYTLMAILLKVIVLSD